MAGKGTSREVFTGAGKKRKGTGGHLDGLKTATELILSATTSLVVAKAGWGKQVVRWNELRGKDRTLRIKGSLIRDL